MFFYPGDSFLLKKLVDIFFFQIGNEKGAFRLGCFQIQRVCFQGTCRILFGVCISKKEKKVWVRYVFLHNTLIGCFLHRKVSAVAVVNGFNDFFGKLQRFAYAGTLELRNCNNISCFLQDAGNNQATVMPSHFLIEGRTAMLTRLQIDNVMKRQHQRDGTP